MEIVENKLNKENRNKGLFVTVGFHIALLLIAFLTMLKKMDTPVEQSFYIDIETEPKVEEPILDEQIIANPPLVNTPADMQSVVTKQNTDAGAAKGTNANNKIGASTGTNKNNLPASAKTGGSNAEIQNGNQSGSEGFVDDKNSDVVLEQKKKYSGLFSSGRGSGNGSGNNNPDGLKGDNGGLPDGKALDGLSKGTGRVGGGLNGRGIEFIPTFSDKSQRTGRIALLICVNKEGKVTGADFTQKGSTTSDSYLIDLARKTALQYRFAKSDIDSQCGTVTIDFKVI